MDVAMATKLWSK